MPLFQVLSVRGVAPFTLAEESSRKRMSKRVFNQCSNDKLWGGTQTCTITFLAAVKPASQIFLDLSFIQIRESSMRRCRAGSMGSCIPIRSDKQSSILIQKSYILGQSHITCMNVPNVLCGQKVQNGCGASPIKCLTLGVRYALWAIFM